MKRQPARDRDDQKKRGVARTDLPSEGKTVSTVPGAARATFPDNRLSATVDIVGADCRFVSNYE
jgi:hypothetical protein